MPHESSCCVMVRLEIMASRSVSNGFNSLWAVAGVDTSDERRNPMSGEGAREAVGDGANVLVVVVVDVLSDVCVMVVTVIVAVFSSVVEAMPIRKVVGLADCDGSICVAVLRICKLSVDWWVS